MNILPSPTGMPTILTARFGQYDPDGPIAKAEEAGAWYSEIYGIATSYPSLVFEPGRVSEIGLCACATCALLGSGRVRDAIVAALGTDIGGVTADGEVRFVAADCGGESRDEPLVTLDGQPQPRMTPEKARKMAQQLRAKGAQTARA